jgi:YcxB-like protein
MAESNCERDDAAPLHPTGTIVAKYQWTLEELTKAIRSHSRLSTRPFFRAAFWVLAIFFCVTGALIAADVGIWEGAFVVGLGLLWPTMSVASAPLLARLQFRKNPNQNAEIEWRFFEDKIQIVGPHSSTRADWSAVFKVAEFPDGLLFYFGPQSFYWIPKNSFGSEADFDAAAELARKNCQTFIKFGGSIFQGFRFRVRNLLWATFWVCVWATALSHLMTFMPNHRPLQELSWPVLLAAVWIPALIVVWTPAIAIGALFDHTRRGALVGLIFVAVLVVLILAVLI